MEKKIKIKIPGDEVMVVDLGNNTAEIKTLTMSPEYSYGDIIMYNDDKEVTLLIKKVTNACSIKYAFTLNDQSGVATKIMNHFKKIEGVMCDPVVPGFILMAYPAGMPESALLDHAKKCPEKVELDLNEGGEEA